MEGDCDLHRQRGRQRISIHSLRMEGDDLCREYGLSVSISIHSLRMEGDVDHRRHNTYADRISIHSLRMEGDFPWKPPIVLLTVISIHSLRMEGDQQIFGRTLKSIISIHSLRMEGDIIQDVCFHTVPEFQSTPSVWRETLREQTATGGTADFNPLPPYGGRPRYSLVTGRYSSFQSTPSVWRETSFSDFNNFRFFISIHSLRMEGDTLNYSDVIHIRKFQSTPSVWRETTAQL